MKKIPRNPDAEWRCGGWSDHQRTRFDATKGTTLLERLQWLEEATSFARELSGAPVVAPPAFANAGLFGVGESPAAYKVMDRKPESGPAGSRSDQPA